MDAMVLMEQQRLMNKVCIDNKNDKIRSRKSPVMR